MRTRGIKISVRLNQSEHAHLMKQTEKSGLPMEVLVRSLIMGTDVKPIPPDQLGEIRRQLSFMGITSIKSPRGQWTGHIDKEDIDAIKSMQSQIWRQVKSF